MPRCPPPPPSSPPPPHARTLMASVRMAGDALCGAAMPMRADGLCQGKRSACPPNQCVWMRAVSGVSGRRHAQTMMWYLWQANHIRGSIMVSISACHADDPGWIPGRGDVHGGTCKRVMQCGAAPPFAKCWCAAAAETQDRAGDLQTFGLTLFPTELSSHKSIRR